MTPSPSSPANKTSEAVDEVLLSSTTSRKKVAIAEKFKRMELELKALKLWAEMILKQEPANAMALEVIGSCKEALFFDPLSDGN